MRKHHDDSIKRRDFLRHGCRALATFFAGAHAPALFAAEELAADDARTNALFATLPGELLPPDANGLRLPAGFRSRVIAHTGRTLLADSSYRWHKSPDGGACYAAEDGGWVYVSNSEVKISEGGGGVGAVRFDAQANIVAAYPILQRTGNNCAGGKTPWQTWLSCEEVDRGQVYECDPFGISAAVVRPALGRFKHEAVAVDTDNGHLYLTEDEPDGCLYRFIPSQALPSLDTGQLEVAEAIEKDGAVQVVWHAVPDPQATTTGTRHQVDRATHFNGGEGIAFHGGLIHFTTKGDNRVWRLDTHSQQLEVLYDAKTATAPHLSGVDNVTITASGDVLVAEDGGDMQIVLLAPNGIVLPIVQIVGQDQSEICGPAFDPSFQRLYFSSQTGPLNRDTDGITYEISRITPA
jgi:uncharacterized protein